MSSVHGQFNSWGTPQPLPIFCNCSVGPHNISSWSQSPPAILYPLCYFSFSSLTTHPIFFCCYMASWVSYKIIKVYLAGIQLEHLERDLKDLMKDELLHLLCISIKGHKVHRYIPISPLLLIHSNHWLHNCVVTHHSHPLRKDCSGLPLPYLSMAS